MIWGCIRGDEKGMMLKVELTMDRLSIWMFWRMGLFLPLGQREH